MSPIEQENVDILFGYTGRQFDELTELQYNLNRWLDPAVGRWISEDPIGFAAGDANVYRYVGNATTKWVDASGLQGGVNDDSYSQGWDWHRRSDGKHYPVVIVITVNGKTVTVVVTMENNSLGKEGRDLGTYYRGYPGNVEPDEGKDDKGNPTLTWVIPRDKEDKDKEELVIAHPDPENKEKPDEESGITILCDDTEKKIYLLINPNLDSGDGKPNDHEVRPRP